MHFKNAKRRFHACVGEVQRPGEHGSCAKCAGIRRPWMVDGEEWRPVPSFPNYLASSFGRVKHASPGRGPIKHAVAPNGYRFVTVIDPDGRKRQPKVHTMVTEAFFGPRPVGIETNHIDFDKANNAPANLEYVTHLENIRHSVRAGRINANRKGKPRRDRRNPLHVEPKGDE